MRTNGRTSSCGAGASMTTTEARGRVSRKYLRNEASPASSRSPASPQPARRTKSPRNLSLSEIAKPCIPLQLGAPAVALDGKRHHKPVGGQQSSQPLRPFDQRNTVSACLFPAQFEDLLRALQAIEVEVPKRTAPHLVDLDQREGGAGHDQSGIARSGTQDRTGQGSLADAEAALQGDHITRPETPGQRSPQPLRGGFVGQGKRKS